MQLSLSKTNFTVAQLPRVMMGLAGACFVCGAASLWWMNSLVSQAQRNTDSKTAEVASSAQVAKQFSETMITYSQTVNSLSQLETNVSPNDFVPTLLKQLQTLGHTSQLDIASIRPAPAPAPPPPPKGQNGTTVVDAKKVAPPAYTTITVAVAVSGTYPHIMKFIHDLTLFPKIMSLTGIQFHATTDNRVPGHANDIGADLQMATYVFPEEASAQVPATQPTTTTAQASGTGTSQQSLQPSLSVANSSTPRTAAKPLPVVHALTSVHAPIGVKSAPNYIATPVPVSLSASETKIIQRNVRTAGVTATMTNGQIKRSSAHLPSQVPLKYIP